MNRPHARSAVAAESSIEQDSAAPVVRGEALGDQLYGRLRDLILSRQLPPGTRLSVPDVARRFKTSRSPAREAVARLGYDGLAHIEPNRGAIVADIETSDLREIYEIREALEGLACRLAASRITESQRARLAAIVKEHEAAAASGDVERHMRLDAQFHSSIREATGRHRLVDLLDRLQGQIRLGMSVTHRSVGGMTQAVEEHRAILAALIAGNSEYAERAGRQHIARLLRELATPRHGVEAPTPQESAK